MPSVSPIQNDFPEFGYPFDLHRFTTRSILNLVMLLDHTQDIELCVDHTLKLIAVDAR